MSELVLVSTVVIFRHNYVVEVPDGKTDLALNAVMKENATEFSQKFVSENIVEHRIIDKNQLREIWTQDEYTWKDAPDSVVYGQVIKINELLGVE